MNKFLIIALVVSLLSGCTWFQTKPRDVVMVTNDTIDTCSAPPKADKIVMRNVDFKVTKDEFGIYWISVTPRFYENLSVNMQEITQHIKQKNAIIKYYETCHDPEVEKVEDSEPSQ